ncbi:L-selectin isoform 1-T1 [Menidia menidia]
MKWTVIFLLGCSVTESSLGWSYHYSKETFNWTSARKWCQTNFTDMVVFRNQRENDYVVSLLPNKTGTPYYWIGITKNHPKDPWMWVGDNSTWIGDNSWDLNEPNNNHSTEFCVEIYVNTSPKRGKWNDEKCSNGKYAVCYKAQCDVATCQKGTCQETIGNTTCLCDPGFEGDRCQTPIKCPAPNPYDDYLICSEEKWTFNTTCQFKCHLLLVIGSSQMSCGADGKWTGPRPVWCASYKQALLAVAGCGAFSSFLCICFCCIKHRKRKKITQERQPEDACSSCDVNG